MLAQGVSPVIQKIMFLKPYKGDRFWSRNFQKSYAPYRALVNLIFNTGIHPVLLSNALSAL